MEHIKQYIILLLSYLAYQVRPPSSSPDDLSFIEVEILYVNASHGCQELKTTAKLNPPSVVTPHFHLIFELVENHTHLVRTLSTFPLLWNLPFSLTKVFLFMMVETLLSYTWYQGVSPYSVGVGVSVSVSVI